MFRLLKMRKLLSFNVTSVSSLAGRFKSETKNIKGLFQTAEKFSG